MKWIKEFVSNVIFRIRFRTSTLDLLMAQLQEGSQPVESAEKNTTGSTDLTNKKK